MAASQDKVIVTCAVTGGIHTPTMSPHLPITADQIAREAIAAAQAGASMNFGLYPMLGRHKEFKYQSVFGLLGGIGAHPDDVMHMRRTAERLFGKDYYWSVLGAGRSQFPLAAMSAAMGGNVRVGLEDSLWDGPGRLATGNARMVQRIVAILASLNLEVATPAETRAMLQLKGRHAVAF